MPKEFIYVHEEPNVNILNLQVHMDGIVGDTIKKFGGANVGAVWYAVEEHRFIWGPNGKDWLAAGDVYFKKMKADPDFALASERHVREAGKKIMQLAKQYFDDQKTLSNEERAQAVKTFFDLNREMCAYGFIGPIMELPHEFVSNELNRLLDEHSAYFTRPREEYLVTLTSPDISDLPSSQAQAELLAMAADVQKGIALTNEQISKHLHAYAWTIYSYRGPLRTPAMVREEVAQLASIPNASGRREESLAALALLKKKQQSYAEELHLTPAEAAFFAGARSIAYTKLLRKDMLSLSNYMTHHLGEAVWKKAGLDFEDIDVLTVEEYLQFLEKGILPSKNELAARRQFELFVIEKEKSWIKTGEAARQWIKDNVDFGADVTDTSEVKGSTASLGSSGALVQGIIKRVETPRDGAKFNDGDILLSSGTTPDLLPVMRRAGGIVTDQGGLTSHAAIVSRELKIACIIGTKQATKIFKDGDHVEMDLTKGIVRKM